jgi:hypothetical protein
MSGLESSVARVHIPGMESQDPQGVAISRWFAVGTAVATASLLAYVAHDDLGLTRQEIRTPSLIAAAIIGLVVATEYFGKRLRKPK